MRKINEMPAELNSDYLNHEQMILLMSAMMDGVKAHRHGWNNNDYNCPSGKDVYLTYEAAEKALRQRGKRGERKQIYKCSICGHYHFTSKDGEFRKARAYDRRKVDLKGKREIQNYLTAANKVEPVGFSNKSLIVRTNCMSVFAY